MKVFVVIGNVPYEFNSIRAVCSTKEKAERAAKHFRQRKYYYDSVDVDEWEIDADFDEAIHV